MLSCCPRRKQPTPTLNPNCHLAGLAELLAFLARVQGKAWQISLKATISKVPSAKRNHNYCLVCCNHDSDSEYDDDGDGVDDDGDCNDGDCDAAAEDDGGDPAGHYDDVDNSLV